MYKPLKLLCPMESFEELYKVAHNARQGTKEVKVSKVALLALLADHNNALARLESLGVDYVEP